MTHIARQYASSAEMEQVQVQLQRIAENQERLHRFLTGQGPAADLDDRTHVDAAGRSHSQVSVSQGVFGYSTAMGSVEAQAAFEESPPGHHDDFELEQVADQLESAAYTSMNPLSRDGGIIASESLPFVDGVPPRNRTMPIARHSPPLRGTRTVQDVTSMYTTIVAPAQADTKWWSSAAETGLGLEHESPGSRDKVLQEVFAILPEEPISRALIADFLGNAHLCMLTEALYPITFLPGTWMTHPGVRVECSASTDRILRRGRTVLDNGQRGTTSAGGSSVAGIILLRDPVSGYDLRRAVSATASADAFAMLCSSSKTPTPW